MTCDSCNGCLKNKNSIDGSWFTTDSLRISVEKLDSVLSSNTKNPDVSVLSSTPKNPEKPVLSSKRKNPDTESGAEVVDVKIARVQDAYKVIMRICVAGDSVIIFDTEFDWKFSECALTSLCDLIDSTVATTRFPAGKEVDYIKYAVHAIVKNAERHYQTEVVDKRTIDEVVEEVRALLNKKNAAYGDSNLDKHGLDGIIVRMSDKLARLENILKGVDACDEQAKDTCIDLIGYAIQLLRRI